MGTLKENEWVSEWIGQGRKKDEILGSPGSATFHLHIGDFHMLFLIQFPCGGNNAI